jgi:hypothetical protein
LHALAGGEYLRSARPEMNGISSSSPLTRHVIDWE